MNPKSFEEVLKVAWRTSAVYRRRLVKYLESSKEARNTLQILLSILVITLLVMMVKSTMTDDGASNAVDSNNIVRYSDTSKLFDDEAPGVDLVDASTDAAPEEPLASSEEEAPHNDMGHSEDSLRSKLVGFFKLHNPEKVSGIDAIIDKYGSRLSDLNSLLMRKYGADLDHPSKSSKPHSVEKETSPKDNDRVDSNVISTKSFVPPKRAIDPETKLHRFLMFHSPEKASSARQLIKKYSLKSLNEKLKRKYGTNLNDDVSQIDSSNEASLSDDVIEKKATAFFRAHRSGESKDWIKAFVQQYRGSVNSYLISHYGYTLDGDKVLVPLEELENALKFFFAQHNPEKQTSVKEAARRFNNDFPKLNQLLKQKYGLDLAGKASGGATPVNSLRRVNFVDEINNSVSSQTFAQSAYFESVLSKAHESGDPVDALATIYSSENGELLDLDDDVIDDVDVIIPGLIKGESAPKIICVGLPLTGCEKFKDFANSVLDLNAPTELDAFRLVEDSLSGLSGIPRWDGFHSFGLVSSVATSYFFEELSVAFPKVRFVVAVRNRTAWWDSFGSHDSWACENNKGEPSCVAVMESLEKLYFGREGRSNARSKYLYMEAYQGFYERVLQLLPLNRRTLVDMHGGTFLSEGLTNLAGSFGKRADSWLKKQSISNKIFTGDEKSVKAGALRMYHRDSGSINGIAVEIGSFLKAAVVGLDASGVESIASGLVDAGMTKVLSNTREWIEATREKSVCHSCDALRHLISHEKEQSITDEEDLVGGAPLLILANVIRRHHPKARFILGLRPISMWLRDIKCFLASFSREDGKTLLRVSQPATLSPVMKNVLSFIYGVPVPSFKSIDVSNYFLARRYQNAVDVISSIVPTELVLTGHADDPSFWSKMCTFLKLPGDCPHVLRASVGRRISKSYC